ncbi:MULTISPECIES: porin [unclassified Acidovorax]|uniref:porin n=1 Tax=unclassified Acidovorax TaxID=2684926 RepID=UPI002883128E|nr:MULTISPECIES: porin [unclassified Acidovorax]
MQKTNRLLLASLALLSTSAAFAQSSVTIYGRVNTTVERQKDGGTTNTVVANNASRFGFRGTEDLGGGLKAGFVLESGFNSDTGTTDSRGFFARQSELNLSGNFGTLRLGRMTAESYYATADYIGLHNHDTGSSSDAFYASVMRNAFTNSNTVAYKTPDFGGLTVQGSVGMHEQTVGGKNVYDLAAYYTLGALELGGGYSKLDDANQVALRAMYTMGPFIVGAYYQRSDDWNAMTDTAAAVGKRDNYRLVGAYMMGASEFHLNVGRAGKYDNVANSSAMQYTLAYNYNLSKRTKLYGYYTRVDNKAGASYFSSAAGNDFSSVAVGVRHAF